MHSKDINAVDENGWTPLIKEIRFVNIQGVHDILLKGASVFASGENRETPLQNAVEKITAVMEDHPKDTQKIANLWKIVEILFEHEVNLRKTGAIPSDQPKQWEIKKDNRGLHGGDETPIEYLTRIENLFKSVADRGKDVKDNRRLQSIHHEVKKNLIDKIFQYYDEIIITKDISSGDTPERAAGSSEGLKESVYRGIITFAGYAGSVAAAVVFGLGSSQPDPARQPLVQAHVKAA